MMGTMLDATLIFWLLFFWRYARQVVHLFSFWLYKPSPVAARPKFTSRDVTVICPTVDPQNKDFVQCLQTILSNNPRELIIVAAGRKLKQQVDQILDKYSYELTQPGSQTTNIKVTSVPIADKRHQCAHAFPSLQTPIVVLANDHVMWGPRFLLSALAPFEDAQVGFVGTNKRVVREIKSSLSERFWNMIGALYLDRHNFEIRATNAIDGGVFVISGRTSLIRTCIVQDAEFLRSFTNEKFFFGLLGPLAPDDDNYITRFMVRHGWKIKVQYTDDARMWTSLGTYPKFPSQCLRWARTTWRSNATSLFTDRSVWTAQPWCVYAVYFTSFFNLALFYDWALFSAFRQSTLYSESTLYPTGLLVAWVFVFKMVKVVPYFIRHPEDLFLLPGYFLFTWYHSLIKLWALLTFWDGTWNGRQLSAIALD